MLNVSVSLIYDYNQLRILLYSNSRFRKKDRLIIRVTDCCLCSPCKVKDDLHTTDAYLNFKRLYFSNKEYTVLVTVAAVTLNSNISIRFTSLFAVPNQIWSSLNFFKVLYIWRQQATSNAVCLVPVTALVSSYGFTSCL